MINVSSQTLEAIQSNEKLKESQTLVSVDLPMISLPIEKVSMKLQGRFIKSNMRMLEVELLGEHSLGGQWFNYERSMTTSSGTFTIPYGSFMVVGEPKYDVASNKTTIKMYDAMVKSQIEVKKEDFNITFPTTTGAIVQKICDIVGLELKSNVFQGSDDPVNQDEWTNTRYTYRDILDHIAEVTANNISISEGKLNVYQSTDTGIVIKERAKLIEIKEHVGTFNILNITEEPQHFNNAFPDIWFNFDKESTIKSLGVPRIELLRDQSFEKGQTLTFSFDSLVVNNERPFPTQLLLYFTQNTASHNQSVYVNTTTKTVTFTLNNSFTRVYIYGADSSANSIAIDCEITGINLTSFIPLDDRKEFVVTNNPIASRNLDYYKPAIFNRIKDISFTTFNADTFGWGIFEVGDIVTVIDKENNQYTSIISGEESEFYQMFLSSVYSNVPSNKQDKYVVATDRQREGQRVYLIVDQQNGIIEGVVEKVDDNTDAIASLKIEVDNLTATVSSLNTSDNLIRNISGTVGSLDYWTFEGGKFMLLEDMKLFSGGKLNQNFIPKIMENSLSEWGLSFYTNGTAITSNAYIVPNEIYSFRAKRHSGLEPYKVNVVEKRQDFSIIKTSQFDIETERYGAFSITPNEETRYINLEFVISNVTPSSRLELTELMFNRGTPTEWKQSSEDVKIWTENQLSIQNDKITLSSQRVDSLSDDIHNAGVEINALNGIEAYGKKFKILNEARDKEIFSVTTIDGEEQVYMYGSLQSEGGEIAFDSENKEIKIGDTYLTSTSTSGMLRIKGNAINLDTDVEGVAFGIQIKGTPIIVKFSSGMATGYFDSIVPRNGGGSIGSNDRRIDTIYLHNQPNVSSDKNLKYNIVDIEDMLLDSFEPLKEKSFKTKHDDKHSFGYIAQEVEACLYDYVNKVWDKEEAERQMNLFKLLSRDSEFMSLLYGEVKVIMLAVVKRDNERIKKQQLLDKEEIKNLKETINKQQEQINDIINLLGKDK